MTPAEVTLKGTTVGDVGQTRVGCGNFWERDYPLPDGTTRRGMSAQLAILETDERLVVGVGSVVDLGARWEVVAIDDTDRGTLRLRRLEA